MAAITADKVTAPRPLTTAAHGEQRPAARWPSSSPSGSCLAFGILVLAVLLVTTFLDGIERFDGPLFTNYTSQIAPETAGARAAILGTAWVILTTALLALPIGVAAAVYLEEFASKKSRFTKFVELNVQNLAAVPAIIYGMLAAAAAVAIGIPRNTVIAGGIALALLILPVVIVATREALRAVPQEIRQASLALGASPMQTLSRQTLPAAIPGIATGTILALSRAMGEAAPLLLLGGLVFVTFDPNGFFSGFTTMPIQIFDWASRSQVEFQQLAAAASIVLLALVIVLNGLRSSSATSTRWPMSDTTPSPMTSLARRTRRETFDRPPDPQTPRESDRGHQHHLDAPTASIDAGRVHPSDGRAPSSGARTSTSTTAASGPSTT